VELRQLVSFLCVARHGHITRAAQALFLTQPALSQQLRRLEQELGVALFTRTPHGVELTPAGTELAERAEVILAEAARARAAMDDHAGARRGVARVAAAAADARGLAAALAGFHVAHPQVRLTLREGSATEVLALLAQGAVDLVLTSLPAPAGAVATPLRDEPLVVAGAAGDPLLAGHASLSVGALREQPLILGERGTTLRRVVLEACQADGFSPVPPLELSDPAAVLTLVRAGLGLAVVPQAWVAGEAGLATAVALAPDGAPLTLRTGLLSGPGPRTPAAELLHAHLVGALAA
jgi:DNA-binding transcriptional LysR family regulator